MEMGSVTVQDTFVTPTWTSVAFLEPFGTRPVVMALPTTDGGDPATLRIRNVTTTGFQILQVEPNANDGPHVAMPTAYLAIEPGNHVLPGGARIVALERSTTSFANRFISTSWDTVAFPATFAGTPAVVAQIQTMANESQSPPTTSSVPFMDVGVRNVNAGSMQMTLERAESVAGSVTVSERVGIVAIENATNLSFTDAFSNSVQLQSLLTPANIRGYGDGCFTNSYAATFASTPLAVATTNSRSGNNGGWLRRCSQSAATLGLTVDEDIDNDSERNHIGEVAGIIAASTAFHANFDVDLLVSKNVSTLSDPFNSGTNPKAIPNADVEYVIGVSNRGSASPDNDTVAIRDDIPSTLRLCVVATCYTGGPIVFDDSGSPVATGVTLGSVEYSNNGGASFSYTPSPDPDGFDDAVNAVRVTLDGVLTSIAPAGAPSFELRLAARVN
ncbi:MAG: hypothetical protein KJP03_09195 [Gammaproteobacteria bacterium]|nr:hypothetical protein [Gammaproteobacteria bacterium]